jgi:hypothetical protein
VVIVFMVIVFVVVGVGVGCNLEKRFFILTLATWETTKRSERARTCLVGERWRRGTGSAVVRGGRRRRRRRVVWGIW